MKMPFSVTLAVGLLLGIAAGVALAFFLQEVWQIAQEHDAHPHRAGMQGRLMLRKSEAMHDLLDDVVLGRHSAAQASVARVRDAAALIDNFLATSIYGDFGNDFHEAIEEVGDAAARGDGPALKSAVLRLEGTCIDCHSLIGAIP
jgi:hypothetical protein